MSDNSKLLTLVTGCNDKYFINLYRSLCCFKYIITKKFNKRFEIFKIIIFNLGLNQNNINLILKKFSELKIIINNFDFEKYPEHVSLKKYHGNDCSYAWKPIIIYDVCIQYGGLIHWFDTRTIYYNFFNLIKILQYKYIYSPVSSGVIEDWTVKKTIDFMT